MFFRSQSPAVFSQHRGLSVPRASCPPSLWLCPRVWESRYGVFLLHDFFLFVLLMFCLHASARLVSPARYFSFAHVGICVGVRSRLQLFLLQVQWSCFVPHHFRTANVVQGGIYPLHLSLQSTLVLGGFSRLGLLAPSSLLSTGAILPPVWEPAAFL